MCITRRSTIVEKQRGIKIKINANQFEAKEVLRLMRDAAEHTQEQFAKSINKSKSTVKHYEYGYRYCSLDTFLEIAKIHGFTVTIEKKD